jgi:hypothetical protein
MFSLETSFFPPLFRLGVKEGYFSIKDNNWIDLVPRNPFYFLKIREE